MTGLYIHMPWCIKKCPYCDFNSHAMADANLLPEPAYIDALLHDFQSDQDAFGVREISSVFIGGGTPSLFSGESYQRLFRRLRDLTPFSPALEITLEANPGAIDQPRFESYLEAGINRLSLGVQSFDAATLKKLGRIHGAEEAHTAIALAKRVGFTRINLDIMYATPGQTVTQGLIDLQLAAAAQPEHISWYQFTLEPNTYFYRYPPALPPEDSMDALETQGLAFLEQQGYARYEISAFQRGQCPSQHNLNYWKFGDYYGIGAGAHGKLTDHKTGVMMRTQKHRLPQKYLAATPERKAVVKQTILSTEDKVFEFMLNATRLVAPVPLALFTERTGLPLDNLYPLLLLAAQKKLITLQDNSWQVSGFGRRYTNELQLLFLRD